jgi:hypothetical protein
MSKRTRQVTRKVKHEFGLTELNDISAAMAKSQGELEEKRRLKKCVVNEFNEAIKRVEGDVSLLARKRRDGYEMRDMECTEIYDYITGEIMVCGPLGEVLETRTMTVEERQQELSFGSDADAGEA